MPGVITESPKRNQVLAYIREREHETFKIQICCHWRSQKF